MKALLVCGLIPVCFAVACSNNSSTTAPSSTTTTTTTTAATPTVTEEFDGTCPVGGSIFYSFTVSQYGTVNITLTGVGGTFVPSTVQMGVGIGTPSGTDCTTTTVTAAASSSAQVTGSYQPGVYCAKVSDVGNLFSPANFTATIAHP